MDPMRWEPSRTLSNLRDEVNSLFDRFFERTGLPSLFEKSWTPAADIMETDENVVVSAEIPGISPQDLQVTIEGDVLSINGEKKQQSKEERNNFHRVERSYGAFARKIRLPAGIKAEQAQAAFKNGVLTITLPKQEVERKQTIQVKVEP